MPGWSLLHFSPPFPDAAYTTPTKGAMVARRPSSHTRHLSGPARGETPTCIRSSSCRVKASHGGSGQCRPLPEPAVTTPPPGLDCTPCVVVGGRRSSPRADHDRVTLR
jgi:hypothetical protein